MLRQERTFKFFAVVSLFIILCSFHPSTLKASNAVPDFERCDPSRDYPQCKLCYRVHVNTRGEEEPYDPTPEARAQYNSCLSAARTTTPSPSDGSADTDGDGVPNGLDNCLSVANPNQADANNNAIGDACEVTDTDGDGVPNSRDNCPTIANSSQSDKDHDLRGDACDEVDTICPIAGNYQCRYCTETPEQDPTWVNCNNDAIAARATRGGSGGGGSTFVPQDYTNKPQGDIIPCDTDCTWDHLYVLVRNAINFMLFYLALPLAVISIAVAGWMFLISGFDESKRTAAKDILWNVVKGLAIALAAWLIVHFIVDVLVEPEVAKEFPTEQQK